MGPKQFCLFWAMNTLWVCFLICWGSDKDTKPILEDGVVVLVFHKREHRVNEITRVPPSVDAYHPGQICS